MSKKACPFLQSEYNAMLIGQEFLDIQYIQGWALGRSVITQKDEKREKKVFNIFTWVK